MADINYMGLPIAGSIPIDDTDIDLHKVWSSGRVDGGMWYELGPATLTNGVVVFDDLNPNFEYKLSWNTVGANGVDVEGTVNEPWVRYYTKTAGTHSTSENPTIKLTYYIGGGTDDISRFCLKYNKGAYGSFTSTQEGYAPVIVVNDIAPVDVAFTLMSGITNFNNKTRVVKCGNTVTAVISIKTSSAVTSTSVDVFTLNDTSLAPSYTVYASGYTSGGLVSFAMTNTGRLVAATVYGSHSGTSGLFGEISWMIGK